MPSDMKFEGAEVIKGGILRTGGPRLVRFLGFEKNRTIRNSY